MWDDTGHDLEGAAHDGSDLYLDCRSLADRLLPRLLLPDLPEEGGGLVKGEASRVSSTVSQCPLASERGGNNLRLEESLRLLSSDLPGSVSCHVCG